MKKLFSAAFAVLIMLAGCNDIVYPPKASYIVDLGEDRDAPPEGANPIADKYRLKKFDITEKKYHFESEIGDEQGEWVFDNGCWTFAAEFNSPQHYRVGINAVALSGSPVVVMGSAAEDPVSGEEKITEYGGFYVSSEDSRSYGDGETEGGYYYLEPVYFPEGHTELYFWVYNGNVRFDKITIDDTKTIQRERFERTTSSLSHSTSSVEAIALFDYLKRQFGQRVLTAQHCTVNTDAELEAVFLATGGRYPAVRFGEASGFLDNLSLADSADSDNSADSADSGEGVPEPPPPVEVGLSERWHEKGGIVGYTWTWDIDIEETGFSLKDAVGEAENNGLSTMSADYVRTLTETGELPASCERLIRDIDGVAAGLALLGGKNIPVLWAPLPDGGSRLNWWGADGGELYVKLWRLLYDRMVNYHGLDNLIWIWSGGSYQYYPGDDRVDIIGETAFSDGMVGSEAVKLNYTSLYSNANLKKFAIIAGSSGLPSPDVMGRDNAGWLIWSLYRGDFIIDEHGGPLPEVKGMLDSFYNHELTVCLDNLPPFG